MINSSFYKCFLCLVLLFIFNDLSSCELCGCSNNLNYNINLTNQNKNLIGLRYFNRRFDTKHLKLFENSEQITSNENYHTVDLIGRVILNQDLQLNFNLPYNLLYQDELGTTTNANGIGDMSFSIGYNIINDINVIEEEIANRLQLNLGAKLPTGKNESFGKNDIARPNFTLGTGSIDFPLGVSYIAAYKKIGFINELVYSFNSTNSNNYKYGNRVGNSTRLFYKYDINTVLDNSNKNDTTTSNFLFSQSENLTLLIPSISYSYEYASKDNFDGDIQEYTGGNISLISLGLDVIINNINLGIWYFQPINQNLGKGNITNTSRFQFSTIFSF